MKHRLLISTLIVTLTCTTMSPAAAQFTSQLPLQLPDLGDVGTSALSHLEEQRLGQSIMNNIRWRSRSYLDDAEIEAYIDSIGQRLVAGAGEGARSFDFFVIRNTMINAFALPGGYIGLHTGLITAAESESEMASVLAHEIAHVSQRHIAQLMQQQGQSSLIVLASILAAIVAARGSGQVGQAAAVAGQASAVAAQLGYTRAFEREADRIGLQALDGAGFDARGMVSFFGRLQRESRVMDSGTPGYLRTHPLTEERMSDLENRVTRMPYKQVVDSPEFGYVRAKLRAGDGLARDAVDYFRARVAGGKGRAADYYGLARAHLRANQVDEARAAFRQAKDKAGASAFFDLLEAELARADKQPDEAQRVLRAALERYPRSRPLNYALLDVLIATGQAGEAARRARQGVQRNGDDVRLWMRLSEAEAALGNRMAHHRAQAEVYVRQGALPSAIEQLEIARRANDGDFYAASEVDARLRTLKEEDAWRRENDEAYRRALERANTR